MAGDWIKMRIDLYEDPAVIEMAEMENVREEVIVGQLHKIWSWVSRQCHDGTVTGVTVEALGRVASLPGFPEMMEQVGWLISGEKNGKPFIEIPKFERHLSQTAKTRALTSSRQKRKRSRTESDKSNAATVTKTLPEKRREEKRRSKDLLPSIPNTTSKGSHSNGEEEGDIWKTLEADVRTRLATRPNVSDRFVAGFIGYCQVKQLVPDDSLAAYITHHNLQIAKTAESAKADKRHREAVEATRSLPAQREGIAAIEVRQSEENQEKAKQANIEARKKAKADRVAKSKAFREARKADDKPAEDQSKIDTVEDFPF